MQRDERRPTCTNCSYRKAVCLYNDSIRYSPPPQSNPTPGAYETDQLEIKSDSIPGTTCSPRVPLLELFSSLPRCPLPDHSAGIAYSTLLAHYCQLSSLTLAAACRSEIKSKLWRLVIPYVTYQRQCVFDGIAALAAIDVWCQRIRRQEDSISGYQQFEPSPDSSAPPEDPATLTKRYLYQATIHHGHCLSRFKRNFA